jgi:glycosyltransferase involved in cell wall biosynthesis
MKASTRNAIVITPTIGTADLELAMNSVRMQAYSRLLHLIVIDGKQYETSALEIIKKVPEYNYKIVTLPWNTGADRWNGHRIFAAFGFLVNEDYVLFLDDDNWFDANHVSSLVSCIEENHLDWAYSMRKIYSVSKHFICLDNCESIGEWPPFSGRINLVDTSCYCLKKEVLLNAGFAWMQKYFGDRTFYNQARKMYPNFRTTSQYTTNYRIGNEEKETDFFLRGNAFMVEKYDNKLPWLSSL